MREVAPHADKTFKDDGGFESLIKLAKTVFGNDKYHDDNYLAMSYMMPRDKKIKEPKKMSHCWRFTGL